MVRLRRTLDADQSEVPSQRQRAGEGGARADARYLQGGLGMGSTDDGAPRGETRSTFTSTIGGVMTEEVGPVTGELEVLTRAEERTLEVLVRYAGAEEWYTVEGSPISLAAGSSSFEGGELHERGVR